MSKIGTIHAELEEQAAALGFESLEQATDAGCEIEWGDNTATLVEPLVVAHRAWLREREEILESLKKLSGDLPVDGEAQHAVERAIRFIEEAHE